MNTEYDVAVIGAGIVGASSALWCQQDGRRILLLDQRSPGGGTSYGNACIIATYACIPINSPDNFRRLPELMFDRDSPLRIDWRHALGHLPWQMSFLRNCAAGRVDEIRGHLAQLLTLTNEGIDPLVALSRAQHCVADGGGCYYVYGGERGYKAAEGEIAVRRQYGASIEVLSGDEFLSREPNVIMPVHRALLFDGARFLLDPQKLIECYVEKLTADGGEFRQARVDSVEPDSSGIDVRLGDRTTVRCKKLVIAGGAWSKSIRGSGAEDLPLGTERGYHVLFKQHRALVKRPVAWMERGFYATPMDHGLRLAGTVELGGLEDTPNPDRIDYLTRSAHAMFGDIGEPDDTWLGFRPTFADALPVIGPSHRSNRVLFAFGHQHIGLTLGGATGKIISDLVAGRNPPIDLQPYSASRFLRS